jgi:hypothetical protein
MGKMAADHGSELHLLRFVGRHRSQLENVVSQILESDTGKIVQDVDWLDYPFNKKDAPWDDEWKSMDFLPDYGGEAWKEFWPDAHPGKLDRIGMPSWDAGGKICIDNQDTWLLVEAKAHLSELASESAACHAQGKSRNKILEACKKAYKDITAEGRKPWSRVQDKWLSRSYQKANRLACLHFLNKILSERARLLYIYFVGDTFKDAPQNREGWEEEISRLHQELGIARHGLKNVHELFLNVQNGEML